MTIEQNNIIKNQSLKSSLCRLIPIVDWPKFHCWPPIGGLRHLNFYKETNGFDKVVKKIGKRVLIDEQKFFEWVDEKNNMSKEGA